MKEAELAIQDIATLIEAVRTEIGIHMDMEGYDVASDKFLISGYERDAEDISRWMEILGASKRLSASLASMGVRIETDFDALLDAFYENRGSPAPRNQLQ